MIPKNTAAALLTSTLLAAGATTSVAQTSTTPAGNASRVAEWSGADADIWHLETETIVTISNASEDETVWLSLDRDVTDGYLDISQSLETDKGTDYTFELRIVIGGGAKYRMSIPSAGRTSGWNPIDRDSGDLANLQDRAFQAMLDDERAIVKGAVEWFIGADDFGSLDVFTGTEQALVLSATSGQAGTLDLNRGGVQGLMRQGAVSVLATQQQQGTVAGVFIVESCVLDYGPGAACHSCCDTNVPHPGPNADCDGLVDSFACCYQEANADYCERLCDSNPGSVVFGTLDLAGCVFTIPFF
ncbi:MAG: hypothetical protein CMJ31_12460 [Phycisphaerae bacterium]|nr:hypothetical protein [Phycisphaerae bacterium]